jgi:hypothetical protein
VITATLFGVLNFHLISIFGVQPKKASPYADHAKVGQRAVQVNSHAPIDSVARNGGMLAARRHPESIDARKAVFRAAAIADQTRVPHSFSHLCAASLC